MHDVRDLLSTINDLPIEVKVIPPTEEPLDDKQIEELGRYFDISNHKDVLLPTYSQLLYVYRVTRDLLLQARMRKVEKRETTLQKIDEEIASRCDIYFGAQEYYKNAIISYNESKDRYGSKGLLNTNLMRDSFDGWLNGTFGKDAKLCDTSSKPVYLYEHLKPKEANKSRAARYLGHNVIEELKEFIKKSGAEIMEDLPQDACSSNKQQYIRKHTFSVVNCKCRDRCRDMCKEDFTCECKRIPRLIMAHLYFIPYEDLSGIRGAHLYYIEEIRNDLTPIGNGRGFDYQKLATAKEKE